MLERAGIRRIDVVTGFATDLVEEHLAGIAAPQVEAVAHFNPFFQVADNLGSCWIVREQMAAGDFLLLNGDTLVSPGVLARVQREDRWPIAVAIDRKDEYDSDDMKVELDGERLVRIGKTLDPGQSHAESIGCLAFRGEGVELFREAVRQEMRTPEGVNHWFLKVIDTLAATGKVGTVSIDGEDWAEVDFLTDIEEAALLTDRWAATG
jgi:choline kinase